MKSILFHLLLLSIPFVPSFSKDRFFQGFEEKEDQFFAGSEQKKTAKTPHKVSSLDQIPIPEAHTGGADFAYVHSALVKLEGTSVKIDRMYLNLRKGPSRFSRILNMAKEGDVFPYAGTLISPDDGAEWFKVRIGDPLEDEPGGERVRAKVTAIESVYLRESPPREGTNGKIIGSLMAGDRVLVDLDESEGKWYRVYAGDQNGYAHKNYLEILRETGDEGRYIKPIEPTPETPKPIEDASEPSTSRPEPKPAPAVVTKDRGAIRRADGGVEIRGVPLFFQGKKDPFDSRGGSGWRPHAYCGPTSLQMVLAYHGVQRSRDSLALTRLNSKGEVMQTNYKASSFRGQMYAKNHGSAYGAMVKMAKYLGFKNTKRQYPTLEPSRNSKRTSMRALVETGRPQIISVKGLLRYTDGSQWRSSNGHILVVRGMTGKGDLIVNDPARNGGNKIMRRADFLKIWRGFTVDIRR
jgi:predicted double-glycine peptidase